MAQLNAAGKVTANGISSFPIGRFIRRKPDSEQRIAQTDVASVLNGNALGGDPHPLSGPFNEEGAFSGVAIFQINAGIAYLKEAVLC